MAWISVDQKLIGGKLRSLYKAIGCSQNEAIGILISLWLWGIDNAEMDGLIVSADRSDIADVLKSGLNPEIDAEKVVESLIQNQWIDDLDGKLYFHDWSEWRSYYNRYVNEKKANAERQAKYKAKKRMEIDGNEESNVTGNVANKEASESQTPNLPSEESSQKNGNKYDKDFEEFWSVYPRKADKGQCYKKYKTRIKDGYSPEELLLAATNYAEQCRRQKTEQQYIKHGKTFLGDTLPFTDFMPRLNEVQKTETTDPGSNPFRR